LSDAPEFNKLWLDDWEPKLLDVEELLMAEPVMPLERLNCAQARD
jgi:hypothetical protein